MTVRDRVVIDAAFVCAHIERLKVSYPELADDADLLAATVEGETDFDRVLDRVTESFLDAVESKEAISKRVANLKERGDRCERKAEAMRALAFGMMTAAGQQSIRLTEATLSIANGRQRLVIDDEAQLPQGFVRLERVPLKAEILTAMGAGESIPGARLEQSDKHLSIRTK